MFTRMNNDIPFHHKENSFIDYKVQPLLPRPYSSDGPAIAAGDVNNDGLLDIYFGGAKNQAGGVFVQQKNGNYVERPHEHFIADKGSEDVDAIFFDMDKDGDLDLYVVSGGYEFPGNSGLLQDRLYENDGGGNFTRLTLPIFHSSGSCVRADDIDKDGDLDLFVGGRIIPGRYPETPESFVLINDGKGNFSINTDVAPDLRFVGMVTDASWIDLNKDSWPDLVVVGEWMPITIYINEKGRLVDKTTSYIKEKTDGWWNRILAADFDDDGDIDFVIGNFGTNNQFHASISRPLTLYYRTMTVMDQ